MTLVVSVRGLAMQYGRRLVFQELSFDLAAGQAAGVVGPNGSGKTTLLRALAGCLLPRSGEIRINGLTPRDATARTGVGYFAGEATLPGSVRAAQWGSLGAGDDVTRESRRLRTLSRWKRVECPVVTRTPEPSTRTRRAVSSSSTGLCTALDTRGRAEARAGRTPIQRGPTLRGR